MKTLPIVDLDSIARNGATSDWRSASPIVGSFLAIAIATWIPFNPASAQQTPTCSVSMTPSTVAPRQEYTMSWSSSNASQLISSYTRDGTSLGTNPIPVTGSVKARQDDVGTYVIKVTPSGPGGTGNECTATLTVSR
jgi:hypothetical protein